MATEVDICNRALAAMGTQSTIVALTESSQEARECKRLLGPVRDELLRKAMWNFARRTVALAQLKERTSAAAWSTAEPAPAWTYSYAYPANCIRVRYLWPAGLFGGVPVNPGYWPISGGYYSGQWASPYAPRGSDWYYCNNPPWPFAVTGDQDETGNDIQVIATDLEDALCVYTKRVTNVSLWDSLFQEAVVTTMAARLAIPLSGDKELLKLNVQLAAQAITEAKVEDGNEGATTFQQSNPDWVCARG